MVRFHTTRFLKVIKLQNQLMLFDPATGKENPYPSHAAQWREYHGNMTAWLFDPWSGVRRLPQDVGSDTQGKLILPTPRVKMRACTAKEFHEAVGNMVSKLQEISFSTEPFKSYYVTIDKSELFAKRVWNPYHLYDKGAPFFYFLKED